MQHPSRHAGKKVKREKKEEHVKNEQKTTNGREAEAVW
jgi:hypothetical protein